VNGAAHILITGSSGFIGRAISRQLLAAGAAVVGVDRQAVGVVPTVGVDLLDADQTCRVVRDLAPFSAVIHLAAVAHGQRLPKPLTCFSANTQITESLLAALDGLQPHFIFSSSVAVYGEDLRTGPVSIRADLRPSTEYGESKKACEERLLASSLRDVDILRLAPVFDSVNLRDVRKRVFLPGTGVRVCLIPSPDYSLCHLETVTRKVVQLVQGGPGGRRLHQVVDPTPYHQRELLSWFSGPIFPLPVALTRPLYWLVRLLPGRKAYALRCLYWKFFNPGLYVPTPP
jgi:nucleoside-diphosphate-sugar epimerase